MIDLAAVRRATGVTQVELASRLRTTQGGVSRIERQSDWRLSTLVAYLDALGVSATLTVSVGEESFIQALNDSGDVTPSD
ncbi:helix-turn-helix domain-containing protein [Mycobacteroides chelonae]|uniref:helix-turn-helix domain-containing protein n=1 Tax=Mycobacteroides chelonae TaxID=1774 RepID=UPI001C2C2862|nr:helix-turn-helix transcriptional regulator [Mycobacteroides chelonae]MBV0917239.1 helix-turn-helix domain-containing protein [Mycobacteroides chelonae]